MARFRSLLAFLVLLIFALTAVSTALAQEEKPPVTGKNSKIQLSGVGWVVYRYMLSDEQLATTPGAALSDTRFNRQDANSFDLDRVYVTAEYTMTDKVSWQTTLEGENLGGATKLFVKRAYVRFKDPMSLTGSTFKFGIYGNVMVGHIDDTWGFRSVTRTGIDRYLGVSSTYTGAGLEGKFIKGLLEYDAMVANNLPYNAQSSTYDSKGNKVDTPDREKYKSLQGRITVTPLPGNAQLKALRLSLFGQYAPRAAGFAVDSTGAVLPNEQLPPSAADNNTVWYDIFPHWKSDRFVLGFEVAQRTDKTAVRKYTRTPVHAVEDVVEKTSRYMGVVGTAQVLKSLRAFARFDSFDPDVDKDGTYTGTGGAVAVKDLKNSVLIAGLAHTYAKGARGILDVEYTSFENPKNAAGKELSPSLDSDVTLSARMELSF